MPVQRKDPDSIKRLGRQAEFAAIVAMTRTANLVRAGLQDHMRDVIDRPTPWTINSLMVRPATKAKPMATVEYREYGSQIPASTYMRALEAGGQRRHKRFELVLIAKGVMQPDEYAFPAKGYPLDSYGNVPGKTIVQILSQLQAFGEQGYRANATAKTLRRRAKKGLGRYFVPQADSGLPRGVWERWGTKAIRPVLLFAYTARYDPMLKFRETGYAIARQRFAGEYAKALREALYTTR